MSSHETEGKNDLLSMLRREEAGLFLGGSRVVIAPALLLGMLGAVMERLFGHQGADAAFREAAYRAGVACGANVHEMLVERGVEDPWEMVRVLVEHVMPGLGWGEFQLVEMRKQPLRIVVRVSKPYVEVTGISSSESPICYPMKWLLAGVLKVVLSEAGFSGDLEAEEVKCVAMGDPHCEVVFREA
ncbi:MAG: hypothetical protein QI223_07385 [Candidatus Korarchaeota archaeon]|nr:hypothetical protein [Candidatus Korarchaeota archaeon]